MAKEPAKELIVEGKVIICPVCKHDKFWLRKTLMNTRAASFFSFDWLNKTSDCQICDRCGHVLWFFRGST